jgi:DNA (cytosine-5)-methyltransferase 3A
MRKELNVCSLFDGMSCLQIALNRIDLKPTKYYASEVDKYAMQVTMANFPDTIQLGDVRNVKGSDLGFIDLLGGGSPCQSFSFAGKRKGMSTKDNIEILTLDHYLELKNQNFEFEGQSYLFWEYMRILEELRVINPNIKFLLENVVMGKKWQKILTRAIGINPIQINSALVSAQNRNRLYWTNIYAEPEGLFGDLVCKIPQPKDKGILLKDILETEVDDKYFLSGKMVDWLNRHSEKRGTKFKQLDGFQKSACITATANVKQNLSSDFIVHNTMPRSSTTGKGGTGPLSRTDGKTYFLDTGNTNAIEIQCVAMRGRNPENPKSRVAGLETEQQLEPRNDGKTNCLTSVQKDNLVISGTLRTHNDGKGFREITSGKGATIPARAREDGSGQNIVSVQGNIRRLTPTECERLQTVTDSYTAHVSDSQRYKMLGNGWTIDVIAHILSYLK